MKAGGETQRSKLYTYLTIIVGFLVTLLIANYIAVYAASGSVNVSGVVYGPPPSTPPTIDSPTSGSTVTGSNTYLVQGGCIAGLVVGVYRNNLFAGSGLCQANGTYSIEIELFVGENTIVVYQYNANGQPSPVSGTITITYSPSRPSGSSSSTSSSSTPPTASNQLTIEYSFSQQGVFVNQPFYIPINFVGGTPPYAISIDWNDGSTSVFSRKDTSQFTVEHTYTKAGYYTVVIQIADQAGHQAMMQFVLLVNGQKGKGTVTTRIAGIPVTMTTKELALTTSAVSFVVGAGAGMIYSRRSRS